MEALGLLLLLLFITGTSGYYDNPDEITRQLEPEAQLELGETSADNEAISSVKQNVNHHDSSSTGPLTLNSLSGYSCYCKEVATETECPDNVHRSDPSKPEGPRFYHKGNESEKERKNLCCKNMWAYGAASVGNMFKRGDNKWSYIEDKGTDLCMREERPFPEGSCCRLTDTYGSIVLRISTMQGRWLPPHYGKHGKESFFTRDGILGSVDHDGKNVSATSVQTFVKKLLEAGRFGGPDTKEFSCGDKLSDEDAAKNTTECLLRTAPQECCCPSKLVDHEERCFPVKGATDEDGAATRTYTVAARTYTANYKTEPVTVGAWSGINTIFNFTPPPLDDETDLQQSTESKEDAGQSSVTLHWDRADQQWNVICTKNETLRFDREETTTSIKNKKRTSTKHLKSINETKCVQLQYVRKCKAGEGSYVKNLTKIKPEGECMNLTKIKPEGECMKQEGLEQLEQSLIYQCPDGYRSGTGGALKFNELCKCNATCR